MGRTAPSPEDLDEQARARIEEFVLRARRVAAHSLAQDRSNLRRLAMGTLHLTHNPETGKTEIDLRLPPEEVVESAAARVRPILLEQEDCYYRSVLKAISRLVDHPEVRANIKAVRQRWDERVRPDSVDPDKVPDVLVSDASNASSARMDQVRLGLAWVYGDVIHHDTDVRATAKAFGVNERYRCAASLVTVAMLFTMRLLESVLAMRRDGLLEINSAVLSEDVVVTPRRLTEDAVVRVAEPGTPLPSFADEDLGPEWSDLRPGSA
ncbi:hypothetical protein [Isoptericola sp. 178]|uniref:hypothetical protein n=1 Tax=Isoptericola sp. 178 TaxID=3064651 RepID=UPI002713B3BD|nr:hypothetical protein [Isoptericola sp. 178]MDO8144925.1 hypothetical protein [Isoptericola sp. 178]